MVGLYAINATALKLPHKAGRRGGESIARWRGCFVYFPASERVAVVSYLVRVNDRN